MSDRGVGWAGRAIAVVLSMGLALAAGGCVSISERYGETAAEGGATIGGQPTIQHPDFPDDVEPSPGIDLAMGLYREEAVPLAFAVSEDGRFAGWWRCETRTKCRSSIDYVARNLIEFCERMALGAQCYLHSLGPRVIGDQPPETSDSWAKPVAVNGTEVRGPDAAKGMLVYFPGHRGWYYERHNYRPKPDAAGGFPLLEALNGEGWDVVRVNMPMQGRSMAWNKADVWRGIAERLRDRYRDEGYARIGFLGYSRGGAELLMALKGGAMLDGVAVIEPDRRGPKLTPEGEVRLEDDDRREDLQTLMTGHPDTPLFFAHFKRSRWYGTLGAGTIASIARDANRSAVLVERPDGYASHFAGGSERFANAYGPCIDAVLAGTRSDGDCADAEPSDTSENWAIGADLEHAGLATIGGEALKARLSRDVFCAVNADGTARSAADWCLTAEGDMLVTDAEADILEPYVHQGEVSWESDGLCHYYYASLEFPRCYQVYRDSEDLWFVDKTTGHVFGKYATRPGAAIKPAPWHCRTTSESKLPTCERMAPTS